MKPQICSDNFVHVSQKVIIMKNVTIKMDNVFDEIYALLVAEYLYSGFVDGMYKWESPDWKNNENSLGLEVTRAQKSTLAT